MSGIHQESFRAFTIYGKEDGRIIDFPLLTPTQDEVRIKVAYVGICGSDLHYYFHGANGSFSIEEPLIPGHEISGVLDLDPQHEIEVGTPVTIFPARPGEPILGLENRPHLWHGVRYFGSAATTPHTQGGMAEFINVPRYMVRPLPKSVSLKVGALAEPLSVALHGVKLAGDLTGKKILVSGSGPIGLLAIVAAKLAGASEVTSTDLFDEALERARRMGSDHVINISREKLSENSYDVIFECSGNVRAVNSVIEAAQRGGTIVQIGMLGSGLHEINLGDVVTKELRLVGAFRFNDEMNEAIMLLADNPHLEACISHIFPLEDVDAAFSIAKDAQRSGKVLLEFPTRRS